MSNLLGYNATEGLVITFLFLLQANIYCFLLKSAALAEGIKAPSQSLPSQVSGQFTGMPYNHRMDEVGMGLGKSSCPTPCSGGVP